MKTDKKQVKGIQDYNYPRIRVDRDIYLKIVEISAESDKTLNEITSVLLAYALKRVSLKTETIEIKKIYIGNQKI